MRKALTSPGTERLTVEIRFDTKTPHAVYVSLRRGLKIARTIVKHEWPLVAVDIAADGREIGFESVGAASFTLKALFKEAGIKAPARLAETAKFVTASAA